MGEHYLLMRPESAAPGNTSDMVSRMIEEDVMISSSSAQPRILFVTPEVAFMPEGTGNSTDHCYVCQPFKCLIFCDIHTISGNIIVSAFM